MDVPSLIALIRLRLDQNLTDEQRQALRAKLTDQAALCDALAEKLSPEQEEQAGIQLPSMSFDEIVALIDALTDEQWKPRSLMPALVGFGLLVVAGVIALVMHMQPPAGDDVATTHPADNAATQQATTQPTTRPAGGDATASNGTATTGPATATTGPATRPVALTAAPMTWQEFVLPAQYQSRSVEGRTAGLFLDKDGKDSVTAKSRREIRLQGTYRLGMMPAAGTMLRLGVADAQELILTFWSGRQGVRIAIDGRRWVIQGYALTRDGPREMITESHSDRGMWQWYGRGVFDVRYQDGALLVCRGEIPMVRIPLAAAPVEGSVTARNARLWQGEVLSCRPLPARTPREARPRPLERIMPATLAWAVDGGGEPALMSDPDTGVVSLSAATNRDEGRAWCELDLPLLTGLEVTVHVRRATAPTSVFARVGNSYYQMQLHSHKGKRVVDPGDRGTMDADVRDGRIVGEQFWVRFRCGIDTILAWTSADGKTWWPRRAQGLYGKRGPFQLGLYAHRDKAAHDIEIGEITVRRFDTIRRVVGVDAALVAKVAAAVDNTVMQASTREKALAVLAGAREQDVDPRRWTTACNMTLATASQHGKVRAEAMGALLVSHCAEATDAQVTGVLDALTELQDLTNSYDLAGVLDGVFSAMGRLCLDAGRPQTLKAIMDASYRRPSPDGRPWTGSRGGVAMDLLRIVLLDAMARDDWQRVRYEARRAMFMACGPGQRDSPALAKWAFDEADIRLGPDDEGDIHTPAAAMWRHPLVVGNYPAVMNVLGEFMFLMKGTHHADACKTVTSRILPDTLVPFDETGEVLQSSHFMIREMIRTTPEMHTLLTDKAYASIGMIRLERARKQNDLATLESLAAQFYGTEPGLGATHVLADRDLSTGNFSSAASRYGALKDDAQYTRRAEAAAKFRLANAMMGVLAGKPVTQSVTLTDQTLSAEQFEQMVTQIASARKSDRPAGAGGGKPVAPGPTGGAARLTHLADVPGSNIRSQRRVPTATAFVLDGDRLYVNHTGRFFAVNCASKEVLWSHLPDPAAPRTARPPQHAGQDAARILHVDGRLYLRSDLEGRPLACFDAKTGKQLWQRRYDHRVLSDPIMVGSSACVISARHDTSDALFLHRVFPDSGEASLSYRLVSVRDEWPAVGRPVVVGDAMIFRTAGCLINCDVRGTIRWARRLPFVPAAVLPELHTDVALDDVIVWQDKSVIFTAPGCPNITSVDAVGGAVRWTLMIHSPTQLIGPIGDNVIALESGRIRALDAATGAVRWTRLLDAEGMTRVLPAANDTLALVALAKVQTRRTPPTGRTVRWLSARDGTTVGEIPIEGDLSLYDVHTLSADATRIVGVSNVVKSKPHAGKVFMIEFDAKSE